MKNTLKRVLSLLLTIVMTIGIAPLSGLVGTDFSGLFDLKAEAETTLSNYFTFSVVDDEATLVSCSTDVSGEVRIPSSYDNTPVRYIGNNAFDGCENITSVILPETISYVGNFAFHSCTGLVSVEIPDSIIPEDIYIDREIVLGDCVFSGCTSLTSIEIPNRVTSIGNSFFMGCTSLKSVVMSDSVSNIGTWTFLGCSSLENVRLPNNLTAITHYMFGNCTSLESIVIPDSAEYISRSAFVSCKNLTSVKIGNNVTEIMEYAFAHCGSLSSVVIPKSVSSIEEGVFSRCDFLTDIYYGGTEEEWNDIEINWTANDPLKNATIHYESTGEGKALDISLLKPLRGTASTKSYKGTDYVAITMASGKTMTGLYKDMVDGGTVELVDIVGTIQNRAGDYVAYQSQNKTNPVATMKVTYADGTTTSYPVVFELYEMEREVDLDISKSIRPIRGNASLAEDAKGEYILIEMLEGQSSVGVYKTTKDGSVISVLDGAEGMFTEQEKLYIFYGSQNTFNPEGRLTVTSADGTQKTYRVVFKLYEMDPYVNVAKGLRPVRGAVTFDSDGTIRIKMTSGQKSVGLYKTMANGAKFNLVDANGRVTNNPSSIMFYMTNNVANVTATMVFTLPDGTIKEQKIIFDMGLDENPDPLVYLTAVRGTASHKDDYIEVKANAGSTGVGLQKDCLVKYTITNVDGVMTENDTRYYIYKSQNPDGVTANINFLQSDGSYKTYKVKFVF